VRFLDLDRPSAELIYTPLDAARRRFEGEAGEQSGDEANKEKKAESSAPTRATAYSIFPIILDGDDGRVLFYSSAADLPATRSAMRQQRLLPPPLARGIYSTLPHVLHPFHAPLAASPLQCGYIRRRACLNVR